jgi:hypothetical protein
MRKEKDWPNNIIKALEKNGIKGHRVQLETPYTKMEKDSEVRKRRKDAGLVFVSPVRVASQEHRTTCIYDDSSLVEYRILASSGGEKARQWKYCSKCSLNYEMPVTNELWSRMQESARKLRILASS